MARQAVVDPAEARERTPWEHGLVLDLGAAKLSVSALSPEVLRIGFAADGRFPPRRPWAVTQLDGWGQVAVNVARAGAGGRLATDALDVEVDGDGRIAIRTRSGGRELLIDTSGPTADLVRQRVEWGQRMPDGRRYYGFGERTGLLEKRGRRYTCWTTDEWRHQGSMTDSLYVAIPYYLSVDPDGSAFGVFMDTTFRSTIDLSAVDEGELRMSVEAPVLEWFYIGGPQPAEVTERLARLLGTASLPPRWALGYHQARWSYATEPEVREVAAALRDHRIPADAIHLDIDHMDRFRPFTWDRERFPDPTRLIADLGRSGLRTTLVVDAAIPQATDGYDVYDQGIERKYFVPRSIDADREPFTGFLWGGISVFPDQTRPDVRRWWGDLYRGYLDLGIAGFLNDMNEPAMHDRPYSDPATSNTEPPGNLPFGRGSERAGHDEVRNVYALLENRAAEDGLRRARPDARPFLMSRSGFAGVQRHAIVWTGDNWSTWEHLEMSLPQLLNLGLSGVPIAGADIGGFYESCTPELLVRWSQLGALYPFARNNSAEDTPHQEPWAFGEPTLSRCRRAIELRYRLLPYLYSVVEEACRTGRPILRPLFLEFPRDARSHGIGDEAMLGRDLLLAPVLRPGQACRAVYLPPGTWLDLRDGTSHEGGDILAGASLDEDVPLYLRGGSIVPTGPVLQSTDERPTDLLTLHVVPDARGHADGVLYEDDGESMAYRSGAWCRTTFRAEARDRAVAVSARRLASGGYEPAARRVDITLHGTAGRVDATLDDDAEWEITLPLPDARE